MADVHLTTPLSEDDVRNLKLGDSVYLSGMMYTGRDEVHIRSLEYLEEGKEIPVDFKDMAIFHCGPIMKKENEHWSVVAAGPTTSTRMNSLEPQFIENFGVRAVIGKGGMSRPTIEAMEKFGCVYLAITGGAAILAANGMKEVKGVEWFDMGMPEAIWIVETENFGPLTVAIDAHSNSLFEGVEKIVEGNIPKIKSKLGLE
ncbi:MAG: fumarate hydratase C-terminal domain-containing protein [Thermoplasmata archaeon]|nr:fumarate hydratase C-terminal domain-containing protein [Thermoplasmata archaeon]